MLIGMNPKLTDEMREALAKEPGKALRIDDDETNKVYFLVEQDIEIESFDEWILREAEIGRQQALRGELVEFDPEKIKREGRKRLQRSKKQ